MGTPILLTSSNPDLLVGIAVVGELVWGPASEALGREIDALAAARRGTDFPPPPLRAAVRDLLRHGGFKPTGRNKPASEYLARAADAEAFPRISGFVDAANFFSLETGWPLSLLDLDLALVGAEALEIREGHAEESFVFNPSGQEIDVSGLIGVARAGGPALGNPVKDSMATKTGPSTRRVLAVLYVSRRLAEPDDVNGLADRLAALIREHGGGASSESRVLVS